MNFLNILLLLSISSYLYAAGPSCNETPISISQLEKIVKSDSVTSMQDFLDKIPKDSMQLFTFVTNSLSLHRGNGEGMVSSMWPRVLRSSTDGKITISFVCNPKNPTYGKVEVLFFDDKTNKVMAKEWDFGPDGKRRKASHRIHDNPISCISCHAGSKIQGEETLKYNFGEYPTWGDCDPKRGITMYGAYDDSIDGESYRRRRPDESESMEGCDTLIQDSKTKELLTKDLIALRQEAKDYQEFRKIQKNNSCFNSLPWSKDKNDIYYPYSKNSQAPDAIQTKRPNLIFNLAYGKLMAKKNLNILKRDPNYELMKYLLPMSNLECSDLPSMINEVMGNRLQIDSPRDLLYSYSEFVGVDDKDWTMNFMSKEKKSSFKAGDYSIHDLVLKEIENEIQPQISKENLDLSCILPAFENPLSCEELKLKFEQARKKNKPKDSVIPCESAITIESKSEGLKGEVDKVVVQLNKQSVENGKKLVALNSKGKCVQCHSVGADSGLSSDFHFIPDENSSKEAIAGSIAILNSRMPELLKKIDHRLIETKTMPPMKNKLTDEDRLDIKTYLQSLIK